MASGKISMVVLAVVLMSLTSAQAQGLLDTSCFQSLLPCTNFFNITKPPATCCGPLKKAFDTQLKCLCAAFENPTLLAAAKVNATVAAQLPLTCGITANPSICTTGAEAPVPASAPMALAPGVSTGASTPAAAPGPASGAASSVGPVSSLVLLLVGFMFY